MSVKSTLLSLHKRLLPEDTGQGFLPYIWLVYLSFLYFPFFIGPQPIQSWVVTIASSVLFVGVYFWEYWQGVKGGLLGIAIMCAMGSFVVDYSAGASVFFVFAGAFAFKAGSPKYALITLFAIVAYIGLFSYWRQLNLLFAFPAMFFTILIGGINIYQREMERKNRLLKLSQEELSKVAATAERERIARDLHDLIGHTLSMITMKTQLANKLIDRDIEAAKRELSDLEQISRQTLSDVRDAVTGFKSRDWAGEVANAKAVLQSSDIHFELDEDMTMPSGLANEVLAMALRELVTNVIRHSTASRCFLALRNNRDVLAFEFRDNGDSQTVKMGNGLNGLKERVEQLHGTLTLDNKAGFAVLIRIPL